jgi:hypothetical protein
MLLFYVDRNEHCRAVKEVYMFGLICTLVLSVVNERNSKSEVLRRKRSCCHEHRLLPSSALLLPPPIPETHCT